MVHDHTIACHASTALRKQKIGSEPAKVRRS